MWMLVALMCFQSAEMEPESINGYVFLENGDRVELVDIRMKSGSPYLLEFHSKGVTSFISLLRLARITKVDDRDYELLFDDGHKESGRINSFTLSGFPVASPDEIEYHNIRHIKRLHIISGAQLRSCLKGHYERFTPHPYCPVCGNLLSIGPYPEEVPETTATVPREHLLSNDHRN